MSVTGLQTVNIFCLDQAHACDPVLPACSGEQSAAWPTDVMQSSSATGCALSPH